MRGKSITDVLTITSMDGTTHSVTITIHGVKENPVVDGSTGSDDEGGADPKPGGGAVPIETQPEAKPDKVLPMEAESPAPEGIDHPNSPEIYRTRQRKVQLDPSTAFCLDDFVGVTRAIESGPQRASVG